MTGIFEFGPFRLDAEARSLFKGDQPVPLTPKATELLIVLVRNAGAVMDKDSLLRAVWPDTSVEEGILAVNIATLRKALQDGEGPGLIETVPRRGYRFVAAPPVPAPSRVQRRHILVFGLAASALLACVPIWFATRSSARNSEVRLAPFAVEAATEVWPAYSPSGDALAYLQGRPADFALVVRPENGSGSVVVDTKLRMGRITWSRDGSRVCYGRKGDFWCAGAAGGSPRLLMRGVVSAQFGPRDESLLFIASVKGKATLMQSTPPGASPSPMNVELPNSAREIVSPLSPDGTRLVIADAQGDCWTVSLSEGRSRRAGYRTRAVSWFPDGRRVMFAEMRTEAGGVLSIAEGDSGSQRRVLQTPSAIHSVSLRADGGRAVFATGNPDWDISEHKMTGEFLQKVAASAAQETAPDWSSIGDRFLFIGNSSGPYAVWIGARMIAPIGRSLYAKPRFSPDGRRVAYVDSQGVRVAPADGGASVLLVRLREHVSTLCWSAAGEHIYFASQGSIWRAPSSGGSPAVIRSGNFVIDASSDGRWIAVSESAGRDLYSTAGDVSLMTPGGGLVPLASDTALAGAFSRDGRRYYTMNKDQRSLVEWDVSARKPVSTIELRLNENDGAFDVSTHPAGGRMLVMTGGLRYDLWTAEGWQP